MRTGLRRPMRSDSVPMKKQPTAKPPNHSDRCADAADHAEGLASVWGDSLESLEAGVKCRNGSSELRGERGKHSGEVCGRGERLRRWSRGGKLPAFVGKEDSNQHRSDLLRAVRVRPAADQEGFLLGEPVLGDLALLPDPWARLIAFHRGTVLNCRWICEFPIAHHPLYQPTNHARLGVSQPFS